MTKNAYGFGEFPGTEEFTKMFENYTFDSPFDMKAMLETQRKNMAAMTEAQQLYIESLRAVAQRQSEIITQMVEDQSCLAKEIIGDGTPQEKIAKNAALFKASYERSVKNMKDLSDMINKSGLDASNVINKRVSATMNEIQSSLEKQGKDKKAA